MEYCKFFFAGMILVLINVFGASNGLQDSRVALKSLEVIPVRAVNCTSTSKASYQCVKIADCKTRRRRGSRRFCKWDGKPSHVCCLDDSVKSPVKASSQIRQKRDDAIYFEDDFRLSPRFSQRFRDWSGEEENSWERPCTNPDHFHRKFDRPDYDRDYNDDAEVIDHGGWGQPLDRNEPECGVLQSEERGRIFAAVVGGSPVQTAASHPWMVAIGQRRSNGDPQWFCGGFLISRKIVITAAHCITKRQATMVRVGDLDLSSDTELAEPQDSEIESTVIHPDHKQPRHYHDIAIVRLKTPVRYTKYVRPICIPPNNGEMYTNSEVTLTGWGNDEYGGESSPILREVQLNVMSNTQCNIKYGGQSTLASNARSLPRGIIDSQLCAGDENGGRDACQGDSGGPIVKMNGRQRFVIGLVSSGLGCGSKLYPGIYTRISYYSDWIRSFL